MYKYMYSVQGTIIIVTSGFTIYITVKNQKYILYSVYDTQITIEHVCSILDLNFQIQNNSIVHCVESDIFVALVGHFWVLVLPMNLK